MNIGDSNILQKGDANGVSLFIFERHFGVDNDSDAFDNTAYSFGLNICKTKPRIIIKNLYLYVDAACELHTIEPVIDNNRAFQSLTYHHSHLRFGVIC